MDAHLFNAISTDVALAQIFSFRLTETPWFYSSGSLGEGENPEIPEVPFMVYNELPSSPYREVDETSNAEQRVFTFYVYDEIGDYERINTVLRHLRRIVKGMVPFTTSEAGFTIRCSDAWWDGISGRIVDPEYHTGVRIGTARFVVSN